MRRRLSSTLLLLAWTWACSEETTPSDAGVEADLGEATGDLGPPELGVADLGGGDAGGDAGTEDARAADASEPWGPVQVDLESASPPPRLSDFRFFRLVEGRPQYNDGVVPYDLNTPLFSDYALKWRAIYVPPGGKVQFHPTGAFEFPVGSALIKSFAIAPDLRSPDQDVRVLETRVLIRYASGWRAYPYLWREDRSEADYHARGAVLPLAFVDPRGQSRQAQYLVPQRVQCLACHEQNDEAGVPFLTILGPKARYLNRDFQHEDGARNQLVDWRERGLLEGLPALDEVPAAFDFAPLATTGTQGLDRSAIETAARDYLDINCAHCHNPRATQGVTSQLYLNFDNEDRFRLGVCKEPGSAGSGSGGLRFDIVPGDADASILLYRTASETAGEMMPLLGRSLRDVPGVEVLRAWIDGMPAERCD